MLPKELTRRRLLRPLPSGHDLTRYNGGMGTHPLNLALRFVLELVALGAMGAWAFRAVQGGARYALALAVPLLAACLWGVFAVPGDPSRSGRAPVPVPGVLRLALELAFFAFGAWALARSGRQAWGLALAGITALHYALSYDRVGWLLQR